MRNKPLKYSHYDIVFQEVPGEITLVFNITGCPHHCDGCHSEYLWAYTGRLLSQDIDSIILKYKDMITCVCFMGGDQNIRELLSLCAKIESKYALSTCVYTGLTLDKFGKAWNDCGWSIPCIDYLKVGPYIKEKGGLDNPNTNQRFLKKNARTIEDWTYKFQQKVY